MISKRERTKIKKVLGSHYVDSVLTELKKAHVTNKFALPHSADMVRRVMCGQPHKDIETAIYAAIEFKHKENNEEKQRRNNLLKQTKTAAVTAV